MTSKVVVLGGGISGLSFAFELQRLAKGAGRALDLTVLERGARAGGKIQSEQAEGFLLEAGPNGYLDSRTAVVDLVQRLGLGERTLAADEASARRFVILGGRLREIPSSPRGLLRSDLLTWGGKLRLLGEPWAPGPPPDFDESVAEFGRRRLGGQATARLLDPFVTGIYAGDIERTSVAAAFPRIAALERDHGGLVRGMIQRRRQAKAAGEAGPGGGPGGPGGALTSFPGGMAEVPTALVEALGEGVVRTGAEAVAVEAQGQRFTVRMSGGEAFGADVVVCMTPAHVARSLLSGLGDDRLVEALAGIMYAPVAVVGLGYRLADLERPPDGFGYLTPRTEDRRVLGMLWSHCIFPGRRAPEGHGLLRCIVGGVRSPEMVGLGDDDLVAQVRSEVADVLGERPDRAPTFVRVARWAQGIPQYERGHLDRVQAVDAACARSPGLYVGGNGLKGVSFDACCAEGLRLAQEVLASLP